jgi:hypothetical protein
VPFIARWPGRISQGSRDSLQSLVDFAPTVLSACGLPVPGRMTGKNQLPDWLLGEPVRTDVVIENHHGAERFHMRTFVTATHKITEYEGLQASLKLLNASGEVVAQSAPHPFSGQTGMYGEECEKGAAKFQLPVSAPLKWSPDQPNLYRLLMIVTDREGNTVDLQSCRVGFRQVEIKDR